LHYSVDTQLNALVARALADPALKATYADLGATPWPAEAEMIGKHRHFRL
jgi:hypothetical protein